MNFDMLDKLTQIEKNLTLNITGYKYAQVDGDRIYFVFNKPQSSRFLRLKRVHNCVYLYKNTYSY